MVPLEKGLFPTRGALGPGFGPAGRGPGAGREAAAGFGPGVGRSAPGFGVGAAGLAPGVGRWPPGLGAADDGVGPGVGLGAADRGSAPGFGPGVGADLAPGLGAAPPAGRVGEAESVPPSAGAWASRRRRTTGASRVDDADLTNSP